MLLKYLRAQTDQNDNKLLWMVSNDSKLLLARLFSLDQSTRDHSCSLSSSRFEKTCVSVLCIWTLHPSSVSQEHHTMPLHHAMTFKQSLLHRNSRAQFISPICQMVTRRYTSRMSNFADMTVDAAMWHPFCLPPCNYSLCEVVRWPPLRVPYQYS